MFGKKINKIKCQNKKKDKKLIFNGKRNLNFPFLKLDKYKIKEKQEWQNKIGFKEESLDMVGNKENKVDLEGVVLV